MVLDIEILRREIHLDEVFQAECPSLEKAKSLG